MKTRNGLNAVIGMGMVLIMLLMGLAFLPVNVQAADPVTPYGTPMIATADYHTVGLKADGTVVAVGLNSYGQCNVSGWTGIVQVSVADYHSVGLKADGTVVAVGWNDHGRCDVGGWTNIVQIAAAGHHTLGLKADGTVVAVGYNSDGQLNVSDWAGIKQVAAGDAHTLGLRADGTVVAVGYNGGGQCNVSDWTDIVQVDVDAYHTVGLKADGTVVAVENNSCGQCEVGTWMGIVQVTAGWVHTIGLKADGTVVAVGYDDSRCDVGGWTDIVQVAADACHTVGLKADGTVVAVGYNSDGQLNVSGWNLGGLATVDIDPNTLNLKSQSDKNAVTAYIELPNGFNVAQIKVATVKMNVKGTLISAQLSPTSVGDYDKDGIADRMVKFDRQVVIGALTGKSGDIILTVTGQLTDGRQFSGSDIIKVINPGK